jgi:hypothetical protein
MKSGEELTGRNTQTDVLENIILRTYENSVPVGCYITF